VIGDSGSGDLSDGGDSDHSGAAVTGGMAKTVMKWQW
jgi:hypothetical protein